MIGDLFARLEYNCPIRILSQGSLRMAMTTFRRPAQLFRQIRMAIGAILVVAVFFYGTLLILDHMDRFIVPGRTDSRSRDSLRAEHAKLLKTALEKYRVATGLYPTLSDNVVDDLKHELVDRGYIISIPHEPLWPDMQYRYASNGRQYALWFHLELPSGQIPAGGACLTGVGIAGSGWWQQPPNCPF
jgi:hypothetical protein